MTARFSTCKVSELLPCIRSSIVDSTSTLSGPKAGLSAKVFSTITDPKTSGILDASQRITSWYGVPSVQAVKFVAQESRCFAATLTFEAAMRSLPWDHLKSKIGGSRWLF